MAERKITAEELTGQHIGQRVRFGFTRKATGVEELITGELRHVAHHGTTVRVSLGKKHGKGLYEAGLNPGHHLIIDPSYTTVELRGVGLPEVESI